jgi:histidine triad (HIT) family protein
MNPAYDPNNIFAKILRGEIPAKKLYEDDFALAFADIAPRAPTHLLVIPKGAYLHLEDFTARAGAEELAGFWRAVHTVANQAGIEGNFRLISNNGAGSGQEVPHFHVHLLSGRKLGPLLAD